MARGSRKGVAKEPRGFKLSHTFPSQARTANIFDLAWSTDGRFLAASTDRRIRVWNANGGPLLHALEETGPVWTVAWSPRDNKVFAAASPDRNVSLWNVETGTVRCRLRGSDGSHGVAWSPDGRFLVQDRDRSIRIWDAETGEQHREFLHDERRSSFGSLAWSPREPLHRSMCVCN
jgi:WD40 repeat protein